MYIPRLDEFELKQIDTMLDLLDTQMIKLELKKLKAENEGSDTEWMIADLDEQLNTLTLFKVQFLNARSVVSTEHVTNS